MRYIDKENVSSCMGLVTLRRHILTHFKVLLVETYSSIRGLLGSDAV